MKRDFFSFLLIVQVVCLPLHSLAGWGFKAHTLINRKAVKLLPGSLGVYFSHNIDYISSHAVDPDLWRENSEKYPNEGPGHYIDVDLYDQEPFKNIPMSFTDFIDKYGEKRVNRWGFAPWRIEQFYQQLVNQFQNGAWEESLLTASALGHYLSDIHMPLHVVENYNGQLSGNKGVHKRWESDMVDAYLLNKIDPEGKIVVMNDPVFEVFKIVNESYQSHRRILRADSLAREGLTEDQIEMIAIWDISMTGTSYIEVLYKETGDLAAERMESAAVAIASFWYSAWIQAGKPTLPGTK